MYGNRQSEEDLIVFSHSKARSPGAPQRGASPSQPAHQNGRRVPPRATRPLALILGCAAAVAIVGCKPGALTSGSASSTPSAATGTAAGGSAQGASSAASAMTALASNAPGVTSFVANLSIHASGRLAADLAGTLYEQTQPSPLIEVRTTVPSGLEAIVAGNTAYLKIGALTRTPGKPWVQAPISGLQSSTGANLAPMIQQLQASDPLAQTQMFTAATNVRELSTPMLNGVRTTEYSGSYGLEAGLARLSPSEGAGLRSDMESGGITATQFTVWVDSKNQVRKISLVETGKSTQIKIVLVIVSLNQSVLIQIPPASEVAGATGITSTPTPTATPTVTTPAVTSTPTPAASTPAPVTSSGPSPVPTSQPTHW
jgi:hypothetical protein